MDDLLTLSQFDFILPPHLIAQEPCPERDHSRLLVLDRKTGDRKHQRFNQVIEYLSPGDVLVVNDTQVIPARLEGKKRSGGRVECLILKYPALAIEQTYTSPCLIKSGGKIRPGSKFILVKVWKVRYCLLPQMGRPWFDSISKGCLILF